MTKGIIVKLVLSFGSEWGRIRIAGGAHQCFFNRASLSRAKDFEALILGQEVKFVEEPDRVNGVRASRMTLIRPVVPEPKGAAS